MFSVEIPAGRNDPVTIVEHFGYEGGKAASRWRKTGQYASAADLVRHRREATQRDFNERLRERKLPASRWKTGPNLVDRLLGKELCVLAWAAERARPDELPVICSRWATLRPKSAGGSLP